MTVDGETDLRLSGDVVKVDLTLRPGDAEQAGITVFGDDTSGTRIGYDTTTGRVFVDRRDSGNVDFHPAFASVEDAPVALVDGAVTIEAYLDRASVELFAAGGRTTITDQVFPNAGPTPSPRGPREARRRSTASASHPSSPRCGRPTKLPGHRRR